MLVTYRLKLLMWKEAIEVLRDKRTLGLMALSALLLPALGLLITGLRAQQVVDVAILDCDNTVLSQNLVKSLISVYNSSGNFRVMYREEVSSVCRSEPGYALTIIIPKGFSDNATSLSKPVIVIFESLVGSVAAAQAEAIANNVLYEFSQNISTRRVLLLSKMANVSVEPSYVLHPVRIVREVVTSAGQVAPPSLQERLAVARFLTFSVFFVLNPAAIAVADAFAGERERGTAELLASLPLRGRDVVLGKLAGGLVLAIIAGVIDAAAVAAYILLVGSIPGRYIISFDLALVHAFETLLAVLVTVAISAPIAVSAPTPRAATTGTTLLTGAATAVFFASLFVDIDKLPPLVFYPLLVVPYTHTVLAINSYALGIYGKTLLHSSLLIVIVAAAIAIAAKIYNPERFVKQA